MTARHVIALDQGTTSTRAIVFDDAGMPVASAQREHRQHFPAPGWVEHDPMEIWEGAQAVLAEALQAAGLAASAVAALGITNQRETIVLWDRASGDPVHPAIVWQDARAEAGIDRFRDAYEALEGRGITGLPLSAYFSAPKLAWLLEHEPALRERAIAGELMFGTVDAWLTWRLTGEHVTDVTNASRTLLMNLQSGEWDDRMLDLFGIPRAVLPRIVASSGVVAVVSDGPLAGVAVAGILGDQQAAAFGHAAFEVGDTKNTYGTGNFLLVNTGSQIVRSEAGLIATAAYRVGDEDMQYALEGSVAVTGSLVQWMRDNLGIIARAAEIEELASHVDDNGGVYIVPAFNGLFAPHWRPDARGTIVGLTRYATKHHIARAALEATAFQSAEVIAAASADMGLPLRELKVDGGMVANDLLMQFQADLLGVPVVRCAVAETTALGVAYAAGLGVRLWPDRATLRALTRAGRTWHPLWDDERRTQQRAIWAKAVERSLDWIAAD